VGRASTLNFFHRHIKFISELNPYWGYAKVREFRSFGRKTNFHERKRYGWITKITFIATICSFSHAPEFCGRLLYLSACSLAVYYCLLFSSRLYFCWKTVSAFDVLTAFFGIRRTNHWLNSSHNVVSSTPRHERLAWLAHTWNLKLNMTIDFHHFYSSSPFW
jgi:hypothetical protein